MKTLEQIFTLENLYDTHKRCRCSKQYKTEVINFELNLAKNLCSIRDDILNRTYAIKKYRKMTIYEPKERKIDWLSYRHRIVQNCLCEHLLRPVLDKKFIKENSACRIGKGTDYARKRFRFFLNQYKKKFGSKGYVLKADFTKYFASINHNFLKAELAKIFDEDILWLLYIYIDSVPENEGIPIGNQTSQWFALLYLNTLDHIIKEKYHIKYYIRYMDDLIILENDKNKLSTILNDLFMDAEKRLLKFNAKTQISAISRGIPFLGFNFYITTNKIVAKIQKNSRNRMRRSMRRNVYLFAFEFRNFNGYMSVVLNYHNYFTKNNCIHKTFFENEKIKNIV